MCRSSREKPDAIGATALVITDSTRPPPHTPPRVIVVSATACEVQSAIFSLLDKTRRTFVSNLTTYPLKISQVTRFVILSYS